MSAVYIITCGEYSDYSIVCVCSTQEKAQAFLDNVPSRWDSYRIEEYDLDHLDDAVEKYARGVRPYMVWMDRDGASKVHEGNYLSTDGEQLYRQNDGITRLIVTRWAPSAEAAVKITNELRVQRLAAETWPADEVSE